MPTEEAAILEGTQDVDPLYHGQEMSMWFVYWVVKLSGGSVAVAGREPSGTRIDITLRQTDREDSPGDR